MSIGLERINVNDTFEDLGMDSLDGVEIVMGIEDEFNIDISDDVVDTLKTVRDVVDFVETKI